MNLFAVLNKGAAYAPPTPRYSSQVMKRTERTRDALLKAIYADETRAWMDLGQEQLEVLRGLTTTLTMANYIEAYDTKHDFTPRQRVICGALSMISQAGASDWVVGVTEAKALTAACDRAKDIVKAASVDAIIYAGIKIQKLRAEVARERL